MKRKRYLGPHRRVRLDPLVRRFELGRLKSLESSEDLRAALLLAAGALLASNEGGLSAAVLVAAGKLYPELADFRPRLLGPAVYVEGAPR